MTLAIGLDVGGTKVAAGVVDTQTGDVVRRLRQPTHAERGGASVLELCSAMVDELGREVGPVGVAVCELVDNEGAVRSGVTVDWQGLDLASALGTHTVESDVRAAALAEARFGAGRGLDNFLYLSVGTGVSHTLVLDGRPYAGAHGFALILGAPPVEATSSGAALASAAGVDTRRAMVEPAHEELVARAADALGQSLAFLMNALDPGAVVVGGGLGVNACYLAQVTAAARAHLGTDPAAGTPISAAGLGEWAGVVGAALSA